MQHELIQRLAALVGYGTGYLRNANALDDWYRHNVFKDARMLFRTSADHALLADDFTLWLSMLKAAGAVRLSLHAAAQFAPATQHNAPAGGYAIVVHYADHHEAWTVGEEQAAWQDDPFFTNGPDVWHYLHARSGGGAIDTCWRGEQLPGRLAVPATDWKALGATIAADLAIDLPSGRGPAAPFYLYDGDHPAWRKLPLLPQSAAAPAHRLATALARQQAQFANDTHPNNEGNAYLGLDAHGEARLQNWGRRLDSWMIEVLMRGANDDTDAGSASGSTPFQRMQPPPAAPAVADGAGAAPAAIAVQSSSGTSPARGKWIARIGLAIAIAAASLFILAVAHVIAGFPWLAILVGLPIALYGHYKKDGSL